MDTKSTKNTKITKFADEPAKPLPKLNGVEIQQIPKPKAGEFQVSEQLRLMEARYGFDRFYFHDNSVVDDQVQPMREAKFVSGLQQTRSQGAMDLYRAIKDLAADRLKLWS